MSTRFWAVKGILYIAVGLASPMLLRDIPSMAIIQTVLLLCMGTLNLYRARRMVHSAPETEI